MTRSTLSSAFYLRPDPLPDEIHCVFCQGTVVPSLQLAYFPSTGWVMVYRLRADGRLAITCSSDCHPVLSLGLEADGFIEVRQHTFPPLDPTCDRCRTAIDRRRWRQVDRRAALGLMRGTGSRMFASYVEALAWASGEHEMLRLHRIQVHGKDWLTLVDLIEGRDELPPILRRAWIAVPMAERSAN
jgi:hypothetical protein